MPRRMARYTTRCRQHEESRLDKTPVVKRMLLQLNRWGRDGASSPQTVEKPIVRMSLVRGMRVSSDKKSKEGNVTRSSGLTRLHCPARIEQTVERSRKGPGVIYALSRPGCPAVIFPLTD